MKTALIVVNRRLTSTLARDVRSGPLPTRGELFRTNIMSWRDPSTFMNSPG